MTTSPPRSPDTPSVRASTSRVAFSSGLTSEVARSHTDPAPLAGLPDAPSFLLFEALDARRRALSHAEAVLGWHRRAEEGYEQWLQTPALDDYDPDPPRLPDPGPRPSLDDLMPALEPSRAAALSEAEIAAEIARGLDPFATAARTGATRRPTRDRPLDLQAALRLAVALEDMTGLARLMAPGAAFLIETGDGLLVEPVAVLLAGEWADLAGVPPVEDGASPCPPHGSSDWSMGPDGTYMTEDEPSLEEIAARAYHEAFEAVMRRTGSPDRGGPTGGTAGGTAGAATGHGGAEPVRVCRHRPSVHRIGPDDLRSGQTLERTSASIAKALQHEAPVLVVVASHHDLPPGHAALALERVRLPPLTPDLVVRHLAASHSATGLVAEAGLRARLPDGAALAGLDAGRLLLALRRPTSLAVAEALAEQVAATTTATDASDLTTLPLPRAVREELLDLAATLRGWREGRVPWSHVDAGVLLEGPPGTGKTTIAAALARSAGVPLIAASYATWQSAGHLGAFQAAVRRDFARAAATPGGVVLLIDEVDALGRRSAGGTDNADYSRKVVNTVLEVLDGAASREGVVVVGATNLPELLDPALLRPGRLGRHIHVPAPDTAALPAVFRYHLGPDLPELGDGLVEEATEALQQLARVGSGLTPADVAEVVRQARKLARRAGRVLAVDDLQAALHERRPALPPTARHRAAVHEAGHAIAYAALGLSIPIALRLTPEGGHAEVETRASPQTEEEHHGTLVALLAGRAAERVVLGSISSGAGGAEDSDLARATRISLAMETSYGLGADGPVWSALGGDPALAFRADPGLKARVRGRLEAAEVEALALVEAHRPVLHALAVRLLADGLVEGRELQEILGPCWWDRDEVHADNEPLSAGWSVRYRGP